MRHAEPLLAGRVVEQSSRFTVLVDLAGSDGAAAGRVATHLANTGNLRAILRPGAAVRVTAVESHRRALRYSMVLAQQWGRWVAVDASLANRLVAEALAERRLAGFRGWHVLKREPRLGQGRLDLLLRRGRRRLWLEVKCTTLVRGGIARFPDPATARGVRHLEALRERVSAGDEAAICFVAQRADARAFRTLPTVAPAFSAALARARAAGVRCHAYRCHVTLQGATLWEAIPVLDGAAAPGARGARP